MKFLSLPTLLAASLLLTGTPVHAAEKADAKTELQAIVTKVQGKLREARSANKEMTEKDLAGEFKEFDALLAAHKGEKTDDVAQILLMKAMLYLQVLENEEKGVPMLTQLKTEFPNSKQAKEVDAMLANIEKQSASKKIQKSLVVGAKFPDFDEQDTAGKPLSIAGRKGKVVLVDFWATWCGPCIAELPNVLKTYEKHHSKGLEIIGISLDQDASKLASFTKEKNMTWPQFFDGKGWGSKLAAKYGVNSIPATYLLDGEGKIIAKDLRGEALEAAVAKALAKK